MLHDLGLPVIKVPAKHAVAFNDLIGTTLFAFCVVFKLTSKGRFHKKVLIIGDKALYQATLSGVLDRCVLVSMLQAAVLCADSMGLAIKIPAEYDAYYRFSSHTDLQTTTRALQVLHMLFHGSALPLSTLMVVSAI
eukprot:TRINITY_DN4288_c0_g1_i2.p1 TRINITY_DN4288_c0_g1~~TRINITY_DN4288_c0_g1_i2.p1  ORF type:complete len:136 (-),score=7.01 TRINITY_DN4288_c0_g1_i2:580-987(-)